LAQVVEGVDVALVEGAGSVGAGRHGRAREHAAMQRVAARAHPVLVVVIVAVADVVPAASATASASGLLRPRRLALARGAVEATAQRAVLFGVLGAHRAPAGPAPGDDHAGAG